MLFILLGLVLAVLWFVPLRVGFRFRQQAWQVDLQVIVGVAFIRVERSVDLSAKMRQTLQKRLRRWRETGEWMGDATTETANHMPAKQLMAAVGPPLRFLGRRTQCTKLEVASVIGGHDAMESALLCGASWSVVGAMLGFLRGFTGIRIRQTKITIEPSFAAPGFRLHANCMLRTQVGHAMVAGIWLLRRVLGAKEVRKWAKDSLRRKGVEGSGRASDSGTDEDGHGEP